MRALLLISALALLASGPAFAEDDPWQGSDLYKRTLVPPDRPDARGSRPLYPWRDGSMHTITEPPPPRPKFDPSQGAGPAHAERSAPRSRQDDNSWQAELEQNKGDPRFCATHTRTASALDRCARAQNGEPQAEDYLYTPGPGQPGRQIVVPGNCPAGYVMTANGCQLKR